MPSADTSPAAGDFHILIVDDEAPVREVLYDLVSTLGYRVTMAGGGREALQLLAIERQRFSGQAFCAKGPCRTRTPSPQNTGRTAIRCLKTTSNTFWWSMTMKTS